MVLQRRERVRQKESVGLIGALKNLKDKERREYVHIYTYIHTRDGRKKLMAIMRNKYKHKFISACPRNRRQMRSQTQLSSYKWCSIIPFFPPFFPRLYILYYIHIYYVLVMTMKLQPVFQKNNVLRV